MWQNSKCDETQNVTKLKNLKYDKTQKLKMRQNSMSQNVTNLKNPKCDCDKTQKVKMWKNSKSLRCDKTQKLKMWQNSKCEKLKTQNVTQLKMW